MKPYGSRWATQKYPGSTKPHGRECGICYPSDQISINKSRARQEEWHEIQEQLEDVVDDNALEDIQRDANEIISDKLVQVRTLLKECQDLARETGTVFYLDLGQSNYFDGDVGYWQNSSSNC